MDFGIRDLSYRPGFTSICDHRTMVYGHILSINVLCLANGFPKLWFPHE